MSLTRKEWNKHREAIKWFYSQPEDAKIWCKIYDTSYPTYMQDWHLTDRPGWTLDGVYVINDEYAEIRKAIADGKEVLVKDVTNCEWVKIRQTNPNDNFYEPVREYRIISGKDLIYKKNDFMVVKFIEDNKFKVLFIFNKEKAAKNGVKIGDVIEGNILDKQWKTVLYDDKRGFWDGQPVWAWDDETEVGRCLEFYNALDKGVFDDDGSRSDFSYYNYEPYPHIEEDHVIESYNKLKF